MGNFIGTVPQSCDICHRAIDKLFVDGKTSMGSWANMCFSCHRSHGFGLGVGKGQKYKLRDDGSWSTDEPKAKASKGPPSEQTMMRWSMDGVAKAKDGCTVEPDGTCEHGSPSWLMALGYV